MSSVSDNSLIPLVIFCEAVPEGSVLSFTRSLGKNSVSVYICLLGDPLGLENIYISSRYCKDVTVVSDESYKDDLVKCSEFLSSISEKIKPILLPFTDKTTLMVAENRKLFDQKFNVVQADSDLILKMLDKESAHRIARKHGLLVPDGMSVKTFPDLKRVSSKMNFPVILKPKDVNSNQSDHFKAITVSNSVECEKIGSGLLADGTVFVVEEYIPGDDSCIEFFLFYRTQQGRLFSCSGTKLLQYPSGQGLMAIGSTGEDNFLEKSCENFLKQIDYVGFGGLEFKQHNGNLYFIEMNVRPEGIIYVAILSGIDMPWLGYTDFAHLQIDAQPERIISATYFNPFCCWGIVNDGVGKVGRFISLSRTLIRNRAKTDILCLFDPKPFFSLAKIMVMRKLVRLFK